MVNFAVKMKAVEGINALMVELRILRCSLRIN